MILERLKRETSDLHVATEAAMPFGDPAFDKVVYVGLLRRLHSFFKTWESSAMRNADPETISLVRERARLDALSRDLVFFKSTPGSDSMPSAYLPRMQDTANLLGSMYVVEGSTLGGQLIARMLETKLSLSCGSGYWFFVGAGSATGKRWKSFCAYLVAWSNHHPSENDALIAAARKTFEAYQSWVGNKAQMEKTSR